MHIHGALIAVWLRFKFPLNTNRRSLTAYFCCRTSLESNIISGSSYKFPFQILTRIEFFYFFFLKSNLMRQSATFPIKQEIVLY